MGKQAHEKNIELWSGQSELYNKSRPVPPESIIKMILSWLHRTPVVVADVGCGTGLSTKIWNDYAKRIIGIEPNDDMRAMAAQHNQTNRITYQKGFSNDTELPSDYVDVITVSQAFHWMDIDSTLNEFHRILKQGGVLAIYDCVWPPVFDWEIEKAYRELMTKSADITYAQSKPPIHNDHASYQERIKSFGKFRYVREVSCHNIEKCTPQRLMDFTLTQGSLSDALKIAPDIKQDVDKFFNLVKEKCHDEFEIIFSYRIVLAVK